MKGIRPLWLLALRSYYRWAMREIHPLHPDAPHVAVRLAELESCNA
jgi:hypothetical protein